MSDDLPPGTPPRTNFDGPYWLQTQIALASTIGIVSFLLFSYCRTRWPIHFASRTKLVDFSPHDAQTHNSFFAWILPTIRISEFAVLQIVGLDAAVLLSFFKMSFYLFSTCSLLAVTILMPINYRVNGRLDSGDPDDGDGDDDGGNGGGGGNDTDTFRWFGIKPSYRANLADGGNPGGGTAPGWGNGGLDWLDLISETNSYLTIPFLFTFIFSLLALNFLYNNYRRFIRTRQLFSLELVHSIPARTVMVTNLPSHLQGERTLAEYFENMNLPVESVSVVREIGNLKDLIDKRTQILLELETAWTNYVGNPSTVEAYDPSQNVRDDTTNFVDGDTEAGRNRLVVPHRPRPILRKSLFGRKVDALEHLEAQFRDMDDQVLKKRRSGKFKATHVAFVTFETMSSAQIASQVVHAPYHSQCLTCPAPEPRDLVWSNMGFSPGEVKTREFIVMGFMALLLLFWLVPIGALSALLSYEEIKKTAPWLGRILDSNDTIRALVQTSLPSLAVISLNATLPFLLEMLCYIQGHRARSWVEYSLLKKYFLFLLINVVFIFLLASTYWNLLRDLANSPASIPQKLALSLQRGAAKHFFLNYVVLQGLGIMPLQLLNLGVVLPRLFYRMFLTRTPRDFAELNAPPMVNYGAVYPQAILVFVITILYSIIQPVILIFGAVYFGVAYVVYKYKLLFVFYKPYESRGQAWPITFNRLIWGIVIFQILMTGIFVLKKKIIFSSLMAPLIAFTCYWGWTTDRDFGPLSSFVSLSSVFEVQRGEAGSEVAKLRVGHPVSLSQSTLNRRRYAQNDETLYVAPEEETTDYSQPPMSNWYNGVLNTGKRRYGHPGLTGALPQPWLPLKKGQTLGNYLHRNGAAEGDKDENDGDAVVLTLRRKPSKVLGRSASRKRNSTANLLGGSTNASPRASYMMGLDQDGQQQQPQDQQGSASGTLTPNPWRDLRPSPAPSTQALRRRLSFDAATGVIMLPEGAWYDNDDTEDEEAYGSEAGSSSDYEGDRGRDPAQQVGSPSKRHSTYYHHPERSRRRTMPGAFSS